MLDILCDRGWHADFQSDDASQFLSVVKSSRSCAVFIDESAEVVGRYNDEMFWLATRGRHYGHNCHFVTQRVVQLNKTVRDQCSQLFLFRVSLDDAKALSNEWAREELRNANSLAQFECFHVTRFGHLRRLYIGA